MCVWNRNVKFLHLDPVKNNETENKTFKKQKLIKMSVGRQKLKVYICIYDTRKKFAFLQLNLQKEINYEINLLRIA